MDHHCSDSDCSDDSSASDNSIGNPPSFNRNLNLELESSIEELKSEFGRNQETLNGQIKELDDAIDELESVHKNTTIGSLVGSSVGAAGGVAALAGLCLAPFTLGASLALTGAGAVAGVAGGVTGTASNITNMVKQKTLRENIEKIINDLQTTIKPMEKLLGKIDKITEEIESQETLNKLDMQRSGRGAADVLNIARVACVADIGKMCAEAAKEIRVYVKTVKAVLGSASAARAALCLDVYSIVQDSKELSEMNQPAGKREEEISSETLTFILQMKAASDLFKKIVEIIQHTKDNTVTYLTQCCETTLHLKPGKDTESMIKNVHKDRNNPYYFAIM